MKKQISIKFTNGLDFEIGLKDILFCVAHEYKFVDSDNPDFIVFGPYGNDIPRPGNYTRIGYFCENFMPDLSICEWAFGIPYVEDIKSDKYARIEWHGVDLNSLIKKDLDLDAVIARKTKFCNFVYSNPVPLRERFFQSLSKYKPVDAPGKSMNNMTSFDANKQGDIWQRKQNFLTEYKFTIAFENYSYPGYNTEKILDPMIVNSLPIYLGNPYINRHFNPKSFINAHEYIETNNSWIINFLEYNCQPDFEDMRPSTFKTLPNKAKRKIKTIGRELKSHLQYKNFDQLINRIIEIDQDDQLYAEYLLEPWFYNNIPPTNHSLISRWRQILG
ncbi:MAG: glycosyltransferase family 10 domain-containing protein [Pseudanabaena sp.]|jgi:hypothetical protein